jgi:hypothetical protein
VGTQWQWNTAQDLFADFNRYQDPGQRRQRVYAAYSAIRAEEDPNVQRQWNFFNRTSKLRDIAAHKQVFRDAIGLIVHSGASHGYTENEKWEYGIWSSQMV